MDNSTVSYKCPNCGGELVFDADRQKFICGWCCSDFSADEITSCAHADAQDSEKAAAAEQFAQDTDVYICSSCGAEIICDHNTAASFCYYCHNPVTLKGRLEGDYRPEKLIPFKIAREKAEEIFKKQCSHKWFLPFDFVSSGQIEKMVGLYVPFWLADCDAEARLTAEGVNVSSYTSGRTTYTTTKIYDVEREGRFHYDGIPADGSKKIDDQIMDAIEPFDYNGLVDFDMAYLSGFFCDKYDVGKVDVLLRIKEKVEAAAVNVLRADISGYTTVRVKRKVVRMLGTDWHYMTLPVWFMNYRHGGKNYNFAINGQTGKVAGIYPVSGPKLAVFMALMAAIVGVAGYFLGVYMGW